MTKPMTVVEAARLGGRARTAALSPEALSRIGRLGGSAPRRTKWRLSRGQLQERDGETWRTVRPPYTGPQLDARYRLRRR